jgi:hypothetical protein
MNKIKCPECKSDKLHILRDAYLCRPINEDYSTDPGEEFEMRFDYFIIECGECGATDDDSPKLQDIAKRM